MFHLIVLGLVFAVFTDGAVLKLNPSIYTSNGKIVGGKDAKIKDYPYMAAFERDGSIICGATIVTTRHVVTAGHCSESFPNLADLSVRVGTDIRDTGGHIAQVRKYIRHPKYTDDSADYDVAVVELKNPLVLSTSVQVIPLQEINQEPPVGSFANVTGWGLTKAAELPWILQVIEVPRVSQEYCIQKWDVTPRMICYGFHEGGKDACGGDSGGPLVVNGKLAGVVSFGGKCAAPNEPGGYTNIANKEIHDFIMNYIW